MLNCWDRDILQYIGRNSATVHGKDAFSGSLPHFHFPLSLTLKSGRVSNKTFYNFHAARRVEKSGVYSIYNPITKQINASSYTRFSYTNYIALVSKHISQLTSEAFCSSTVGIVKSSSANAIVGDNTAVTEAIVASDVLKKAVLSVDVLYA